MDERITVRSARIPVIVRGGEGLSAPQATGQVVCRLLGPLAVLGPIRGRGDSHDLGELLRRMTTIPPPHPDPNVGDRHVRLPQQASHLPHPQPSKQRDWRHANLVVEDPPHLRRREIQAAGDAQGRPASLRLLAAPLIEEQTCSCDLLTHMDAGKSFQLDTRRGRSDMFACQACIDEGAGPLTLAVPVFDVVGFRTHPDPSSQGGRGGIASIHLRSDAV